MGPVRMVVVDLLDYLIMKYPIPLVSVILAASSLLCVKFFVLEISVCMFCAIWESTQSQDCICYFGILKMCVDLKNRHLSQVISKLHKVCTQSPDIFCI